MLYRQDLAFLSFVRTLPLPPFLLAPVVAALLPTAAAAGVTPPPLPAYAVKDLGTLKGDDYSQGNAINSQGDAVGYSSTFFPGITHAFLYRAGKLIDLGAAPSGNSGANAINAGGQVVGYTARQDGSTMTGFLYASAKAQAFGLPGSTASEALGINNLGQVVGYFVNASRRQHAYLRQTDGQISDLGTVFGGTDAEALSINNRGQIAGWFRAADGVEHAFLTQAGGTTPKDLGNLGGPGRDAVAFSVNDLGQVVGYAVTAQSTPGTQTPYHAFRYADGKMADLGTLGGHYSWANGLNAEGQIVGAADVADGDIHGWVYVQGKLRDLNGLLDPATQGWVITGANGVNDAGEIIATGSFKGVNPHAVILTPLH